MSKNRKIVGRYNIHTNAFEFGFWIGTRFYIFGTMSEKEAA